MNNPVSVRSQRVSPAEFTGEYDLAIFVSSFESRCTRSSIYEGLHFKNSITVFFSEMKNMREELGHDQVIFQKASFATVKHSHLQPSVTEYDGTTREILQNLASMLDSSKPNRIFFDITTCPKYYFAAVLSQLFLSGFVDRYTLFYAEGRYSADTPVIEFTKTEWKLHTVPGLEGQFDPTLGRGFQLSVGFESLKVRRLVSRYLPDNIVLLEANPGFNSEYTDKAFVAAQDVLAFCGTASTHYQEGIQIIAAAGDAAAAYAELEAARERGLLDIDRFNWTLIPCGPKPHALAMVIFALSNPRCCFAYPAPDCYGNYRSEATGVDWVYEIADTSLSFV
ncbi:MAG: hypothetical protein ACYC1M_18890 [Armatimonadota bacterium]